MFKNKLLSFATIICILLLLLLVTNSLANNQPTPASNQANPKINQPTPSSDFFNNQKVAVEQYHIMLKEFKSNKANRSNINKEYPDNFGGSYIDKEGNLNINIVGEDANDIKALLKSDKVKYHKVKYSKNYLEELVDKLNKCAIEHPDEFGIEQVVLSESNNKIIVYLRNMSDNEINAVKKIVDSPAIEFAKSLGRVTPTAETKVNELSNKE